MTTFGILENNHTFDEVFYGESQFKPIFVNFGNYQTLFYGTEIIRNDSSKKWEEFNSNNRKISPKALEYAHSVNFGIIGDWGYSDNDKLPKISEETAYDIAAIFYRKSTKIAFYDNGILNYIGIRIAQTPEKDIYLITAENGERAIADYYHNSNALSNIRFSTNRFEKAVKLAVSVDFINNRHSKKLIKNTDTSTDLTNDDVETFSIFDDNSKTNSSSEEIKKIKEIIENNQ